MTVGVAQAITFSGPPIVGNRKLTWNWEALPGIDPAFQGNTLLVSEGTRPAPVPGTLRYLATDANDTVLFGVGSVDDRIYRWNPATGALLNVLPAPPSPLRSFDVHRSGLLVLAGLEDGRVAVWDLREGAELDPSLYAAQRSATTLARFLVSSTDPDDQRFVSAGPEDTLRVWSEPGSLLRRIVAGSATAIGLTPAGSLLAVSDPNGIIRVYEPVRGTILQRLEGHAASISALIFSSDQRKLVSLDTTGKIVIWPTSTWSQGAEFEVDATAGLTLGLRQPDGALVYTIDGEGFVQIFDGNDGRPYRSADITPGAAFAPLFALSGRRIYAGRDDGTLQVYRTGFCQPSGDDPVCFGGYQVWRSDTPEEEDAVLLRVFAFGDSTWGFHGTERIFADPDSLIGRGADPEEPLAGPHNGQPYYYSLTPFERHYLNGSVFDVLLNTVEEGFYRAEPDGPPTPVRAHESARVERPLLGRVIVVPNPYEAGLVPWDQEIGEHVEFRNLPEQATIRIYSVAGDLLREIEHGSDEFGESTNARGWDLKNTRGEKVTSGVYIYHIKTRLSAEETKGYFIVVR
jgi:hypothetical protein